MAATTQNTQRFLERLLRLDLSLLLGPCDVSIETELGDEVDGKWFSDMPIDRVIIRAPQPVDDALRALSPEDRKRVAEAVASGCADKRTFSDITVVTKEGNVAGSAGLLAELIIHRAMMISVATGGERIQEVDDYYVAREHRIRRALPEGVNYVNPHQNLWEWYEHWSANFSTWAERRRYVRGIFASAIGNIGKRTAQQVVEREPSGWERVDRTLAKAQAQLEGANAEEDYQAVGLLCREVIISAAQAVFDDKIHTSVDGVKPSATDANRMLDSYVAHEFPGESFKEVRAHHRASLALALNLQHRRTATRMLARLCIEATASTVAVVSIIARESP